MTHTYTVKTSITAGHAKAEIYRAPDDAPEHAALMESGDGFETKKEARAWGLGRVAEIKAREGEG
jgi:hypothetical protein